MPARGYGAAQPQQGWTAVAERSATRFGFTHAEFGRAIKLSCL